MKKLLMLLAVLTMTITTAMAQTTTTQKKSSALTTYEKGRNTIGLRIGNDIEASYQKYIGKSNRIEAGLGYNFEYGFNIAAVYQWLWGLDISGLGFNWYAGAGLNTGIWYDKFGLGVVGQVGIEYNFKIPLALSLDWRPSIHLLPGDMHFGWEGFAVAARYRF